MLPRALSLALLAASAALDFAHADAREVHTRLTYKRNGTDATLTDGQEARVVTEILA